MKHKRYCLKNGISTSFIPEEYWILIFFVCTAVVRTSCQKKYLLFPHSTLAATASPEGRALCSVHLSSSDLENSEICRETSHVSYMSHLTHLHSNLLSYCIFYILTIFWILDSDIEKLLFLSKESTSIRKEVQKYRYYWYKTQSTNYTCNGRWRPSQGKVGSWRSGMRAEENGVTKTRSVWKVQRLHWPALLPGIMHSDQPRVLWEPRRFSKSL